MVLFFFALLNGDKIGVFKGVYLRVSLKDGD